ncbi:MAG TPA: hypothetical protein VJ438_05815 [Candidatus Nanoarchaeia archaeon]|nr:hypothetical protein [Candidatus Nanoarchaeia archaeon]
MAKDLATEVSGGKVQVIRKGYAPQVILEQAMKKFNQTGQV